MVSDCVPASGEVTRRVAVAIMRNAFGLADVECLSVSLTVVRMVADRLHPDGLAVVYHDVRIVARRFASLHDLELVLLSRHAVLLT